MVGRSNVGKSSLINAVLNRKGIARVSQTPGKTQAVQFYLINEKFYLVDLPGYGYAKVPKSMSRSWGELVRGYLESAETLRLIFLLLDVRRTPGEHDLQMHHWSPRAGRRGREDRADQERQACPTTSSPPACATSPKSSSSTTPS